MYQVMEVAQGIGTAICSSESSISVYGGWGKAILRINSRGTAAVVIAVTVGVSIYAASKVIACRAVTAKQ